MPENRSFPPEGFRTPAVHSLQDLHTAMKDREILEASALRCDAGHMLHFSLNGIHGKMPRHESVAPWISGSQRDISVLSRVGKQTCFTVMQITSDEKGAPVALLSRRAAQEQAIDYFLEHLEEGAILTCRVIRMEAFGVFLDIGCGIIAMLPIERISVSRITHPRERFYEGQKILAAVWKFDRPQRRITMTHRELLGNWMENASRFQVGETVRGIVRSVMDYGNFIELSPNLSGLSDARDDLAVGDSVSVYIKSIRPEQMKVKLHIIEKLPPAQELDPPHYQITDGTLTHWVYSPPCCEKPPMGTDFTVSGS